MSAVRPAPPVPYRNRISALWSAVQPQPQLLEGERVTLVVRMAPYRAAAPGAILRAWGWLTVLGLALSGALGAVILPQGRPLYLALIPILHTGLALVWAVVEQLQYNQWRILVTDRRTIIYMPAPGGWPRVDTINLQSGRIQVVDTSWSRSWLWRPYQVWSGSRDLVLGLGGYVFKDGQAEVSGGLVMPDVAADDILQLQELVFPARKP